MSQTNSDIIVARLLEADDDDLEPNLGKELTGGPEKKKYLPLGSYSSATMREEDLIPRFINALKWADPKKGQELEAETETLSEDELPDFCSDLFDVLDEYAPPYTYFGSHPGDGADYGVWISTESIDDDLRYENGDLVAQEAGEPFFPGQAEYVVIVDRAGDYTTLLDGKTGEEIWSI